MGRIEDIAVDAVTGAVVAIDAIDGLILLDAPAPRLRVGAYLPLVGAMP
jgi:hypothetical protein